MKGVRHVHAKREDTELITNNDLVHAVHELMGGIDLDVASSKVANTYVEADSYFTPSDDALNEQDWSGKVYLFPPSGAYFWDLSQARWRITRTSSPSLTSSHAVWFRKLYHAWVAGAVEQATFFCNCPDMFRYEQKIFDFPMCILKTAPKLFRRIGNEIARHTTCTSFVLYLPPPTDTDKAIQNFIDIYEEKGRILV